MNRYGRLAMEHWRRSLPDRWARIPEAEREEFFTRLGLEAELQVAELTETLAGPTPHGETLVGRAARLSWARAVAEERVMLERVFAAPTTQE